MITTLVALLAWLAPAAPQRTPAGTAPGPESFDMRVVTTGLAGPWELLIGPDGWLWVTERTGKRITRVNPADGTKTVLVEIPDVLQSVQQDGLLGMAIDGNNVYVAMTYDADAGAAVTRRMKIRRYAYDAAAKTLGHPADIIDNLPAGSDHLSGRLRFGPDRKLYLTLGDGGKNQLAVYCQPIDAQVLPTAADVASRNWPKVYQGKILRIDLDGSIPADNPTIAGVRSHIYSYGHRNSQGLAFGPDGTLYASEHGPSVDDELNRIQAGKNYGWPYVAGYQDDRAYSYQNWSAAPNCASLKWDAIVAPPSVPEQKESAWHGADFVPPIQTFFTVPSDYDFKTGNATIAPSGIDIYHVRQGGIPGWADSVLVTSLLRGVVYRVKLNAAGTATDGAPLAYFRQDDRYRDLALTADGRTIYAATDPNSALHKGAIVAFTYRR
ncbi:MAG TPA: glucose/sorbosone family PQQ-dependent dehydrogenase [Vicinamibacterales bacterium]|nr:glucose/sorbosone family PQQ-dependent dehydrogenase [Vicinamibacterales bacterium]